MGRRRPIVLVLALAALAILVALPVMAASPAPSAGPAASHAQGKPENAGKPDKAGKPEHEAEVPVTVTGTVEATTDADGEIGYTLTSGGTTYALGAGPSWFWGDKHPLKAYVGKTVTITGEQAAGSAEVDVLTVDGKALREAGKPPWAGGWKVVGKAHPGWSQEKADRFKAKFGDCFPPGQCKDKAPGPAAAP
jgi:hypothetical protein